MNNERHGLWHIAQIGPKILNSILLPPPLELLKLCRHTHTSRPSCVTLMLTDSPFNSGLIQEPQRAHQTTAAPHTTVEASGTEPVRTWVHSVDMQSARHWVLRRHPLAK